MQKLALIASNHCFAEKKKMHMNLYNLHLY